MARASLARTPRPTVTRPSKVVITLTGEEQIGRHVRAAEAAKAFDLMERWSMSLSGGGGANRRRGWVCNSYENDTVAVSECPIRAVLECAARCEAKVAETKVAAEVGMARLADGEIQAREAHRRAEEADPRRSSPMLPAAGPAEAGEGSAGSPDPTP